MNLSRSISKVNVAINNQVGVVITPQKLQQLRERLKRLQESEDAEEQPLAKAAPITLPEPQAQLQADVGARNGTSGAPAADQGSVLIMPGGKGVRVSSLRQSPTLRAALDYEPPQPERKNGVGW